jgi:predicted small metal-binding protein
MKRIVCGDLVPGCTFKAQAETEAEVLHVEMDHVRAAHGLEATPQFLERARQRIREVEGRRGSRPRPEAGFGAGESPMVQGG